MRQLTPMAAAVCAIVTLAGCAPTNEIGSQASNELRFGPESPHGLVIVGVRSSKDTGEVGWFTTPRQPWAIRWSRFDIDSLKFIEPFDDMSTRRTNCLTTSGFPFGCKEDPRVLQYTAHLVNPGYYALREAYWGAGALTTFAANEPSLVLDNSLGTFLQTKKVPWFQVGAGEAVYIGDYVFDAADHVVEFEGLEQSDEQIKALRHLMPGMRSEIQFRGSRVGTVQEPFRLSAEGVD